MSLRLSAACFWSLADDGHDHFSDSELPKAAGKRIDRTRRKFMSESEKKIGKKMFIEIQCTAKFSDPTFLFSYKNLIFDPNIFLNFWKLSAFKDVNLASTWSLSQHSLAAQNNIIIYILLLRPSELRGEIPPLDNRWGKNYKFRRCFWFRAFYFSSSHERRLQNDEKEKLSEGKKVRKRVYDKTINKSK